MGRRSEHSRDELRALIIDASVGLVREHGAENVTARQIARAVGYTPGMLYAAFVNQRDIFLHVNVVTLDALYQTCSTASKSASNPTECLHAMAYAYHDFAANHPHQFDLLFTRIDDQSLDPPATLKARVQALFGLVENALRELNPEKTAANLILASRALWSGVHGASELSLSSLLFIDEQDDTPSAPNTLVIDSVVTTFVVGWMS